MADSAILAAGGADAPLTYLVPGAAAITIKQVHVKYVDNGAAGDWLPAVRIVNDAGHTMGTAADQGVKVTSGSDADVSFFPGVKHAAAASSGVDSWLRVVAGLSTPSGTYDPLAGTVMPISTFDTNDLVRFVQVDAQHWTMISGAYIINGAVRPSGGAAVVADGDFTGGLLSGGGFVANTFIGNGERTDGKAIASMTIGDQSSGSQWKCEVGGSDTHSWAVEVDIIYVQGT